MRCTICGTEFENPHLEADESFAALLGAEPGGTCEACSEVVIGGSPEDLSALLERHTAGGSRQD